MVNDTAPRPYGSEAAGGGVVETDSNPEDLGPCPGCGAMLGTVACIKPNGDRRELALAHPMPFCHYFGATDPGDITRDMLRAIHKGLRQ